jgi:CheY-like chemotaxis protein
LEAGALTYLTKPVTTEGLDKVFANIREFVDHPVRRLLVVEDNEVERNSIAEFIGDGDVETTVVGTGAEALTALKAQRFDCMVLDLMLPDMTWFELIETIKKEVGLFGLPIIVYTAKELTVQEEAQLRKVAQTIIVKGVKSPDRLLDETALFLHRVEGNLSESKRQVLQQLHQQEPLLVDKHILLVDDDIRNIFALTSVLERHQMRVSHAENGKDGLELLKKTRGIDIVLMDIMMPEMDGYETIRAIRQISKFKALPVIGLTAKAMKGDRERCIEAGASDYISKPVDTEQLLSLLRVWLYYR